MKYRAIFDDVFVYILRHWHTTLHRESIVLYTNLFQRFKELVKRDNRRNCQVFSCKIKGDISIQKLQNFWVAKALMSPCILCFSNPDRTKSI